MVPVQQLNFQTAEYKHDSPHFGLGKGCRHTSIEVTPGNKVNKTSRV